MYMRGRGSRGCPTVVAETVTARRLEKRVGGNFWRVETGWRPLGGGQKRLKGLTLTQDGEGGRVVTPMVAPTPLNCNPVWDSLGQKQRQECTPPNQTGHKRSIRQSLGPRPLSGDQALCHTPRSTAPVAACVCDQPGTARTVVPRSTMQPDPHLWTGQLGRLGLLPSHTCCPQQMSTGFNNCQHISTTLNNCQQLPTTANNCQRVSTGAIKSQQVSQPFASGWVFGDMAAPGYGTPPHTRLSEDGLWCPCPPPSLSSP